MEFNSIEELIKWIDEKALKKLKKKKLLESFSSNQESGQYEVRD
jgi:hypothetical protein